MSAAAIVYSDFLVFFCIFFPRSLSLHPNLLVANPKHKQIVYRTKEADLSHLRTQILAHYVGLNMGLHIRKTPPSFGWKSCWVIKQFFFFFLLRHTCFPLTTPPTQGPITDPASLFSHFSLLSPPPPPHTSLIQFDITFFRAQPFYNPDTCIHITPTRRSRGAKNNHRVN